MFPHKINPAFNWWVLVVDKCADEGKLLIKIIKKIISLFSRKKFYFIDKINGDSSQYFL